MRFSDESPKIAHAIYQGLLPERFRSTSFGAVFATSVAIRRSPTIQRIRLIRIRGDFVRQINRRSMDVRFRMTRCWQASALASIEPAI